MTTARTETPEASQAAPAVGIRLDRSVGRPVPERDTSGPRGTYGCACVSRDMRECILVRYRGLFDNLHDYCECLCHHWEDEDDAR